MGTRITLSRAAGVSLAVAALAGCGGGGLTASKRSVRDPVAPPSPGPAVVSALPPSSPPTQSFKIPLTAAAPSRARGSGTIGIYRKLGEVCWTFGKLVGVPHPVGAEIDYDPVSPRALLPFGSGYTPSGCIRGGGNVAVALAEIPAVTSRVDADFLVAVHAIRHKAVVTVLSGAL